MRITKKRIVITVVCVIIGLSILSAIFNGGPSKEQKEIERLSRELKATQDALSAKLATGAPPSPTSPASPHGKSCTKPTASTERTYVIVNTNPPVSTPLATPAPAVPPVRERPIFAATTAPSASTTAPVAPSTATVVVVKSNIRRTPDDIRDEIKLTERKLKEAKKDLAYTKSAARNSTRFQLTYKTQIDRYATKVEELEEKLAKLKAELIGVESVTPF